MTFWIIASLEELFISCSSFLSVLIIVGLQEYTELRGFSDELSQPSFLAGWNIALSLSLISGTTFISDVAPVM